MVLFYIFILKNGVVQNAAVTSLRLLPRQGKAADQLVYDPAARDVFFQIVEDECLDSLGSSFCDRCV